MTATITPERRDTTCKAQTILAAVKGLPPGINPRTHPLICRHFFGVEQPPHARDLKLRRDVERLHGLSARVTLELLREIGATRQIQTYIEQRTAAFANLDPDDLAVTGGDQFPPAPLH